ncbi:MAG TPA: DUF1508 domain-containing protein [Pyrinomonadaceae bacterium]|jgi:uncharacterized protein YegP (UPF0339 family)
MTEQREMLRAQRERFAERACGLKSYVKELTETAARHGTDAALIEEDLRKARGDIEFYEREAARLAEELGDADARRRFQVYEDEAGEWRWRLLAGNGRIIAAAGEGYRHRQDCLHAVELVKDSKEARVEGAD